MPQKGFKNGEGVFVAKLSKFSIGNYQYKLFFRFYSFSKELVLFHQRRESIFDLNYATLGNSPQSFIKVFKLL